MSDYAPAEESKNPDGSELTAMSNMTASAPSASELILLVDDNPQIRHALRAVLVPRGYTIVDARNGEEALDLIRRERVELVLLDVNLPDMSGFEICREIRRVSDTPVIVLSVRDSERDKVQAFEAGADDYVVKPFGAEELIARVRATIRRAGTDESPGFVFPNLKIDFERRTVSVKNRIMRLTCKEFELLRQLVTNKDRTLTHRRLIQAVWGPDYGEETESLRVLINQLRKKVEPDPGKPRYIVTEPWVGYRFESPREK